jgi:hypothetical protein
MQWEYRVVMTSIWNWSMEQYAEGAESLLNQLGHEGWELVSVKESYLFLKRRLN